MIKNIIINGLRGFGKQVQINFSCPNKTEKGSGLNIIVGPNNSGKTTIFEAIKYYNTRDEDGISFSEGKRNRKNASNIDIIYSNEEGKKFEIHTIEDGGSKVKISNEGINEHYPFCLPSRRGCNFIMHNSNFIMNRNNFSTNLLNNSYNRSLSLSQYEWMAKE